MKFGYFTLSDNHYVDNRRGANQFVADILDEAIYAEEVGIHSAWIGEHHFDCWASSPAPISCSRMSRRARKTSALRRPSACLPLHHPIRVAEQWATLDLLSGGRVDFAAGRGYDRREYEPFHVSFEDNQSIFEEGMEIVRRLWESEAPMSHHGKHYHFDDVAITPKPVQRPIPAYVASFSQPSIELAARLGCNLIVAPFAAALTLWRVAADGGCLSRGLRQARPSAGPAHVQLFHCISPTRRRPKRRRARGRSATTGNARPPAFPGDPKTAPPSYRYFIEIVERLQKVRPEDLTENSVLLGTPAHITDTLKKVEAAGFDEVILYVNVGLKPHPQVKDEMARFMPPRSRPLSPKSCRPGWHHRSRATWFKISSGCERLHRAQDAIALTLSPIGSKPPPSRGGCDGQDDAIKMDRASRGA